MSGSAWIATGLHFLHRLGLDECTGRGYCLRRSLHRRPPDPEELVMSQTSASPRPSPSSFHVGSFARSGTRIAPRIGSRVAGSASARRQARMGHAPALDTRQAIGQGAGRDRRLHRRWPEPDRSGDERLGRSGAGWWLNLQTDPNATVVLPTGHRDVRARAAVGEEREQLWARFLALNSSAFTDASAALRSRETTLVVLEPRQ